MELRQLEYSASSPKPKAFTRPPAALMPTGPLSYQLKQLEAELNVTLFERTRQGVRLTKKSETAVRPLRQPARVREIDGLEVAKVGKKRVLRLGITPTTVRTIMP